MLSGEEMGNAVKSLFAMVFVVVAVIVGVAGGVGYCIGHHTAEQPHMTK